MTSTAARRPDQLAFQALHTYVSAVNATTRRFAGNNVMSIAEGLADSPTRNRVAGECRYIPGVYLPLSGDPLRRRARPAADTQAKVSRDPPRWPGTGRGGPRRGFGLPERLSADSFYYVSPAARDGPESARETLSGQEGRGQGAGREPDRQPNIRTRRLRTDFPLEGQQGGVSSPSRA